MSKKLISAALMATTFAWAVSVAFLPVAANAQSATDTQSQIAALLAQIQTLQAQLNAQGGAPAAAPAAASYSFTKDLTLGSRGADVTALQTLLINEGYLSSSATGYFGAMTKAALIKYQMAKGISPASGFFGPKSRAFVNSLSVSTPATPGTPATPATPGTPATPATPATPVVVAPATGLAVSLASVNPAAGSLISSSGAGSSRVPVLAVNFTAGNAAGVTVSAVNFHKMGVLSDSAVAGAYLTQNGKVLYQYNSLNSGVLSFSGMNLSVPAGQTVTLTLAIDVSGGLSAGNTTGFSMNAASDVTSFDANNTAITASGVFPLNGNAFTVTSVSNPSLASITVSSSSIGNQVTAGTQGNLVGAWNFNVQNSKVYLKGLNFHVIGSANKGDIRNVKLMVNGTQVGATLAIVGQDGTAFFDASATPGVLNTGSNNLQLFADVMGSPSYTFQFEILNGYDILAIDSQYNIPVSAGSNVGTAVSIAQGQITVTQDANTPTGNIAKGQTSVTLAKFDVYAAGESVKIKYLPFSLVFTGVATTTLSNVIQNVSIVDDAGGQVGTTINQPGSSSDSNGTWTPSSTKTYTGSFGSENSPINYTIPANTTRVLSLKADIQSGADFSTIVGNLRSGTNNLQGMISSAAGSTSGANGSSLSLAASSLSVTANNALGTQNISAGVTNQKIGSYAFTASSAEGVNVNNISIAMSATAPFQNLKVMAKGVQLGSTQGTVSGSGSYTFSGTPFNVPAGTTVIVDVYADTLSSASIGTIGTVTTLTGISATGQVSYSSISLVSSVPGQSITFAGASTITGGSDSTQAPAGQIVMGSTGNSLATFRFTETANVENVKITKLIVTDVVTASGVIPKAAFSNLTLWNGSAALGSAASAATLSAATGSATYTYEFNFANPVIVPQANSISFTLKGDAASYASAGATDNSVNIFSIAATSSVTALGATSNRSATVSSVATASGNRQTVLRSTLTAAVAPIAGTQHNKANPDSIGTITFSANNAGSVSLNSVKVTFSGSLLTANATQTAAFLNTVVLVDGNGTGIVTGSMATTSNDGTSSVSWTFTNGFAISAGGSYTFTLKADPTQVAGTANTAQSLGANIQAATDVQYTDALDNSGVGSLGLPSSVVPLTINSITYPIGN